LRRSTASKTVWENVIREKQEAKRLSVRRAMSARTSVIKELIYGNIRPSDPSFLQKTKELQEAQKTLGCPSGKSVCSIK